MFGPNYYLDCEKPEIYAKLHSSLEQLESLSKPSRPCLSTDEIESMQNYNESINAINFLKNLDNIFDNLPKIKIFLQGLRTKDSSRSFFSRFFGTKNYEYFCRDICIKVDEFINVPENLEDNPDSQAQFLFYLRSSISKYLKRGGNTSRKILLQRFSDVVERAIAGVYSADPGKKIIGKDYISRQNTELESSKQHMSVDDLTHALKITKGTVAFFKSNMQAKFNATHTNFMQRAYYQTILKSYNKILENAETNLEKLINVYSKDNEPRSYSIPEFINIVQKAHELSINAMKKCEGSQEDIHKSFCAALNTSPDSWNKIESSVSFINNRGLISKVKSILTPANLLGCFSHLSGKAVRGISSEDETSPHLLNAWQTELKDEHSDKTLFKGIRTGNTRGQDIATQELVKFALYSKFSKEEIETAAKKPSSGNEIILKLSSMQLLTECITWLKPLGMGDGDIASKQIKKLKDWNNGTKLIDIEVTDDDGIKTIKQLKITLDLLAFNFGSNVQYTRFPTLARSEKAKDERYNKESLVKMLGEDFETNREKSDINKKDFNIKNERALWHQTLIGAYLRETGHDEKEQKIVVQLARQISHIYKTKSYEKHTNNPYAIQSRIIYLTYLLGYVSQFNCKSGKDRTGICDAEVKYLAESAEFNGIIPYPYEDVDKLVKFNVSQMVYNGGGLDITRANTGVKGYKIFNPAGTFNSVEQRAGAIRLASALAKG